MQSGTFSNIKYNDAFLMQKRVAASLGLSSMELVGRLVSSFPKPLLSACYHFCQHLLNVISLSTHDSSRQKMSGIFLNL
jgi:hypothetical protein